MISTKTLSLAGLMMVASVALAGCSAEATTTASPETDPTSLTLALVPSQDQNHSIEAMQKHVAVENSPSSASSRVTHNKTPSNQHAQYAVRREHHPIYSFGQASLQILEWRMEMPFVPAYATQTPTERGEYLQSSVLPLSQLCSMYRGKVLCVTATHATSDLLIDLAEGSPAHHS